MYTYCIITMNGSKHFVNSASQIDWSRQIMHDFVVCDNGEKYINKKSIAEIRRVKYYNELLDLAEGQRIKLSEYNHLRPEKHITFDEFIALNYKQND